MLYLNIIKRIKQKKKKISNKIRNNSPIIYDSMSKSNDVDEIRNSKSPNFYNKKDSEN